MKRCGKSAPREAQATRHGKPHRVQGQIGNPGAARSKFRESETGFGYRSPRQMILSAARRRQNSAYSPSKTNHCFLGGQFKSGLILSGRAGAVFCGICGDKTTGALKLPTRSTARMEMVSGVGFSKSRSVRFAGRICVAQTPFARNCKTQSQAGSPPEFSQRTLNREFSPVVTASLGLPGGVESSHGDAGTSAACGYSLRMIPANAGLSVRFRK